MKDLLRALDVIQGYNSRPLMQAVADFQQFTGQKVPSEAVDQFELTGLNNIDMFRSDWLNRFGLKNIYQHETS